MTDNTVDITKDLPLSNTVSNNDLIVIVRSGVLSTIKFSDFKARITSNT
jgi:hypothetical protein